MLVFHVLIPPVLHTPGSVDVLRPHDSPFVVPRRYSAASRSLLISGVDVASTPARQDWRFRDR